MLGNKTITTIGSAVMDIMFYSEEFNIINNSKDVTRKKLLGFEFGAKIISDDVHFTHGGGAVNAAVTFARQGLPVQVLSCVGNDEAGRDIIGLLRHNHIGHQLVQISRDKHTAVSWIVNSTKLADHIAFFYPGARSELEISPRTVKALRTPWIYCTSLTGVKKLPQALQALFIHAAKHDQRLAWNPGVGELELGYSKLKKLFALTYVLIVNLDEALQLLQSAGVKHLATLPPRGVVKKLHSLGQTITVVTNGEKGAYVYDGRTLLFKSALKNIKVVNTAGAGDAFGSGLVSGLIRYKGNVSRALSLAVYNSGSVVTHYGAQAGILTTAKIQSLNL
ncbi:MAG: carbohydrate kinase family protein [Candidatus Komeilibacteria bacterium]